jgi:hypothetical protein
VLSLPSPPDTTIRSTTSDPAVEADELPEQADRKPSISHHIRCDFRTSAPKAQEAHGRVGPLRTSAENARQKLEEDAAQHAKNAKVIDAGQRADTKLRLRLGSRLSDAISGADLLPVWFVTAFGPMAPSRNANDWMDAATDVLAYRVTYQITDPVVALGTPPDGHRAPRRTAWHQDLTRELRRWGYCPPPQTGLGPCHADGT